TLEKEQNDEKKAIPVEIITNVKKNVTVVVTEIKKDVEHKTEYVAARVKEIPVIREVPEIKNYVTNYVTAKNETNDTDVYNDIDNTVVQNTNNTNVNDNDTFNTDVTKIDDNSNNTIDNSHDNNNTDNSNNDVNYDQGDEPAIVDNGIGGDEVTGSDDGNDYYESSDYDTDVNYDSMEESDTEDNYEEIGGDEDAEWGMPDGTMIDGDSEEENTGIDYSDYDYAEDDYLGEDEFTAPDNTQPEETPICSLPAPSVGYDTTTNDLNTETTENETTKSWNRKGKYSNGYWAIDITSYDLEKGTVTFNGYDYSASTGKDSPACEKKVATIVDKDTMTYNGVKIHWNGDDTFTFTNKEDVKILAGQLADSETIDVEHGGETFKRS
ncbi:MAG: hypothetical protein Q4B70_18550, partial [Lachnospiraceae bacterium]|nr:hypothetical protein [Lachnospiraceae bacterium]